MKVLLDLSREDFTCLSAIVSQFKRYEEDYLTSDELSQVDRIANILNEAYNKSKIEPISINDKKLTPGKLYHMFTKDDQDDIKVEWYVILDRFDGNNIYTNSCISFATFITDKQVINYVTAEEHRKWGLAENILSIDEVKDEHVIDVYNKIVKLYANDFMVDLDWDEALKGNFKNN